MSRSRLSSKPRSVAPKKRANSRIFPGKGSRSRRPAAHFEQAIRAAPGFFEARYNYGVVLEQLGRKREAASQYERVLEIQPDLAAARQRLARLRRQLKTRG